MKMPIGLTRRRFLGRTLSSGVIPVAVGVPALAASDPLMGETRTPVEGATATIAPVGQSNWLRRLLDRLKSPSGSSLVGFSRSEPGAIDGTVLLKLLEFPSITDFGAVADDKTDNIVPIQRAIDALAAAGGGGLLVPAGVFRISGALYLRSHVRLQGVGSAAVIHLVNGNRGSAVRAQGSRSSPLSGISVRDLSVVGDARYTEATPSVINGSGLAFVYTDDCDVSGVAVTGFSDNGITFLNGHRNSVISCRVEETAQGISFTANEITVSGNVAIGNRISNTRQYNGLHLEGGFGAKDLGEVRHTTLSGNTIDESWEVGINIELAPYTSCVGNTVRRSGTGRTTTNMGIKVYGGFRSTVCGNTIADSTGFGIVVGANSGECAVDGNTTAGNQGGLLLTDSGGVQVANDVAIGVNSFTEGDVQTVGNVRVRNRTLGFSFANQPSPDSQTLDWYEEKSFLPTIDAQPVSGSAKYLVQEGAFTRIGNVVHFSIRVEWADHAGSGVAFVHGLPYPARAQTHFLVMWRVRGDEGLSMQSASLSASEAIIRLSVPVRPTVGGRTLAQSPQAVTISGQYLTFG